MSLVTGLYRSWLKCIKAILLLARLESGVETKPFTNSFQTGTDTVLPRGTVINPLDKFGQQSYYKAFRITDNSCLIFVSLGALSAVRERQRFCHDAVVISGWLPTSLQTSHVNLKRNKQIQCCLQLFQFVNNQMNSLCRMGLSLVP